VLSAAVEVDRRDFPVCAELAVAPGERLALFGPSGAGKTTILETVAGLVRPRRAQITLGGRVLTSTAPPRADVPPWRRRVGLLRQDPGLFPHLSVRANLTYGPGAGSHGPELAALAARLGIEGLLDAMPARLSGGQQHRVALGRLLLARCDALLLDEPYAGLDASLRRGLTDLVRALVADRRVPSVLVAHELEEAQAFADQLAVLDHGVILQAGAPGEVVRHPASRRVAELVGYLGFVPVTGAVAGIHPERVVAGAQPGRGLVLAGPLTAVRPSGAGWEAGITVAGQPVACRLPDRPEPDNGQLTVTALDPPLFGPDGTALGQAGQERTVVSRCGPDGADQ
jgi:ABC-type sulfate/molybdate transport systems ATPase subunit